MKRTFVFGDIHGCYREMMALYNTLVKEANLDPEKDVVGFLGDYTDRGPDSKKVIDQLIKWRKAYPNWFFLYGNHEDLMLEALIGQSYGGYNSFDLWYTQGGLQTQQSYLQQGFAKYDLQTMARHDRRHVISRHIQWMVDNLAVYFEDDKYCYVHGGVLPNTPLKEHVKILNEGSKQDRFTLIKAMLWAREEFIESNYKWEKKVIFGHSADHRGKYSGDGRRLQPIVMPNKIGLDTAVCPPASWKLTAIELPSEKIYQVDSFARLEFMSQHI